VTHTPLRPARLPDAEPESSWASRRGKWPWIAGGVLVVVVAAGSGAYAFGVGGDRAGAGGPTATADAAALSGADGAGAVSGVDGVFVFTVSGTECGVDKVGPDELPQRAKGQFCVVDVSVKNTGTEAALLDPGAQRGVDGHGREHPVADRAGVFLNDREPSLLDEIPPGVTVRGALAFDVPAGERLAVLVLHESMGSRGVRVRLS
jgi:hypothetical protein